jgi:hypothetical protein
MLVVVGDDGGRFFVESVDSADFVIAVTARKSDAVSNPEVSHEVGTARLINKFQAFDDDRVEKAKVVLAHAPDCFRCPFLVFKFDPIADHFPSLCYINISQIMLQNEGEQAKSK